MVCYNLSTLVQASAQNCPKEKPIGYIMSTSKDLRFLGSELVFMSDLSLGMGSAGFWPLLLVKKYSF